MFNIIISYFMILSINNEIVYFNYNKYELVVFPIKICIVIAKRYLRSLSKDTSTALIYKDSSVRILKTV